MSRTMAYGVKGTTRVEGWRKGLLYAGACVMMLLGMLATSSGWASVQVDCADLAALKGQTQDKIGSMAPDCGPNLEIVSSPNVGTDNSRLKLGKTTRMTLS